MDPDEEYYANRGMGGAEAGMAYGMGGQAHAMQSTPQPESASGVPPQCGDEEGDDRDATGGTGGGEAEEGDDRDATGGRDATWGAGEGEAVAEEERRQDPYLPLDPLEKLRDISYNMNQQHEASRTDIDELLRRLLVTESRLEEVLGGEADGKALVICRRYEVDRARENLDEALECSRKEKEALEEELLRKGQEEQELEQKLAEEEENEAKSGPRATMSEASRTLHLLNELEEKERLMRELERKEVHKDEILEDAKKTFESLVKENDDLRVITTEEIREAERCREMSLQDRGELLAEYDTLQERYRDQDRKTGDLRDQRLGEESYYAQLLQVQSALEADLRSSREGMRQAELELADRERRDAGDEDLELMRLEDVMMLLKAAAVSLGDDHQFIGLVCQKVLEVEEGEFRGLDAFSQAFAFVRRYVEETLGPQPDGVRWGPAEGGETNWGSVPYEAVEVLLSALKQMVVCFDMMYEEGKRAVTFSREIVLNSGHLLSLIQETVCKYKEIELAREAEAARLLEEEQERKRRQEAKKYAPRQNYNPYSRKAPSLSGPRPSPYRTSAPAESPSPAPATQEP
eukprot:Hpha_TRINITY_DN16480_c6_g3::TRINITY_DN16480_c6_g3_i1::g.163754::m.163754